MKFPQKLMVRKDLGKRGLVVPYGLNPTMKGLAGKTVTIIRRDNGGQGAYFKIKEDGGQWSWSMPMFEKWKKHVTPEATGWLKGNNLLYFKTFHDTDKVYGFKLTGSPRCYKCNTPVYKEGYVYFIKDGRGVYYITRTGKKSKQNCPKCNAPRCFEYDYRRIIKIQEEAERLFRSKNV